MSEKGSPHLSHDEHATHLEIERPGYGTSSGSDEQEKEPYQEHGPGIDHKIPQEDAIPAEPELWWSKTRRAFREPISEYV